MGKLSSIPAGFLMISGVTENNYPAQIWLIWDNKYGNDTLGFNTNSSKWLCFDIMLMLYNVECCLRQKLHSYTWLLKCFK